MGIRYSPGYPARSRSRLARHPDLLGGPATGPAGVEVDERRLRVLRGAQLDEVVDDEPVSPETANPLAVGKLEVDALVVLEAIELEVDVDRPLRDGE